MSEEGKTAQTDTRPEAVSHSERPAGSARPKAQRVPAREVPAQERVKGFGAVDLGFTEADAMLEASRCLNCKRPQCRQGCPVNVNIPQMLAHVAAGEFEQALQTVRQDNLLPSICGRVCPQESQCEGSCVLGRRGAPIAIGQIERFIGDKASELAPAADAVAQPLVGDSPKRIAVVGSGPSGITCALEMARAGYEVSLFESLHRLGGVLTYGIPLFRLPDEVVARELKALEELGVHVEMSCVVGRTVTVPELLDEQHFDAAFIGVGAGLPKLLNVPGENLIGVFCANEYLTRVNLMGAYAFPQVATPVRRGKNVVVFGGGNVAMDAARTALRLGAQSVSLAYRRTEAEMPARRAEVEHAKAEGVQFLELCAPLEFVGDESGSVQTARLQKMQLGEAGPDGRRRPVALEGPDSILEVPCDVAVTAIGTNACPLVPLIAPQLERTKWGYIAADEQGRTSDPRIWAGGDIVTGAATVILAMGAGKRAAADMKRTLGGE